jgi:hypothetical protein
MHKYAHARLRVKPLQDKVDELNVELAEGGTREGQ